MAIRRLGKMRNTFVNLILFCLQTNGHRIAYLKLDYTRNLTSVTVQITSLDTCGLLFNYPRRKRKRPKDKDDNFDES